MQQEHVFDNRKANVQPAFERSGAGARYGGGGMSDSARARGGYNQDQESGAEY